ncbi:MAG: tRNA pseudouridine(38-40) synthase TruA [Opitutales bacterium]
MRWKCTVAYDGTGFEGWQAQRGGNTIQQFLERRLGFLLGSPVRIHGSGRTDSGVHAVGQVFHFDGEWRHGAEKLLKALRTGLPEAILVTAAEAVPDAFHARSSATGKRYLYRFFEGDAPPFEVRYCHSLGYRRVDHERMNEAARRLLGRHDFSAFGANRRDDSEENPVKDLRLLEVTREGPRLTLATEGSGYLYKMVRSLAGCLLDVGLGKLSPDAAEAILHGRERTALVVTAPARGLTLERVDYD